MAQTPLTKFNNVKSLEVIRCKPQPLQRALYIYSCPGKFDDDGIQGTLPVHYARSLFIHIIDVRIPLNNTMQSFSSLI